VLSRIAEIDGLFYAAQFLLGSFVVCFQENLDTCIIFFIVNFLLLAAILNKPQINT
jgi:uncharacterized membrane protein